MRVLIVEDEPLIAMDLEDIVRETSPATCVWARTLADGLARAGEGFDLALLDFDLAGRTSVPIARRLRELHVRFCFVSGSLDELPAQFLSIPRISKPFDSAAIRRFLTPV